MEKGAYDPMISAQIIRDSMNPVGVRLTTAIWVYPKYIHGEVMTHRALSKNASSSRAIPTAKMLGWVVNDPAMPSSWPKNQAGMQAKEELDVDTALECEAIINEMKFACVKGVEELNSKGLHKQNANRYLEPWLHMTTLVSGTDWINLFALRVHKDAQPEFQRLAHKMLVAYLQSVPETLRVGEWHLPFREYTEDDLDVQQMIKVCTGRCARVSYKNQEGEYSVSDDIKLHDRLIAQNPGHWTPTEHIAMARDDIGYQCRMTGTSSNFRGWTQYRKTFPARENITNLDLAEHLRDYEISVGICTVCHGEGCPRCQ